MEKIFSYKTEGNELKLNIELPQGHTQSELIEELQEQWKTSDCAQQCFGKNVLINGRITTGMALWLGHTLAHISKSVAIFDPKENSYITVIEH